MKKLWDQWWATFHRGESRCLPTRIILARDEIQAFGFVSASGQWLPDFGSDRLRSRCITAER